MADSQPPLALQSFTPSKPLTLGVELELQLLSTHDFDLAPQAQDLLRETARHTPAPGTSSPRSRAA